MELCGVDWGMFINCKKYCLSLFHLNRNEISEGEFLLLHYNMNRGESTLLNLKSILFKYNTLLNNLY